MDWGKNLGAKKIFLKHLTYTHESLPPQWSQMTKDAHFFVPLLFSLAWMVHSWIEIEHFSYCSQKVGRTTESKSILVYEYYWWFLYKQDIQVTKRISIVRLFRKNFLSTVWKTPLFLTFIEQAFSTPVRLNQVFLPQVVLLLATIQSCSRDTYYFLICFKKRLSSSKLHSTEIGGFYQSFCPSLFGVCASITYLTLLLMNVLALVYVHFWILDSYLDQSPAFLTSNDFI